MILRSLSVLGLAALLASACADKNSGAKSNQDMAGGGGGADLSGCAVTDTCDVNSDPDAGGANGCGLNSCQLQGAACGPIGDGCGGTLQCGNCASGQACGAGGMPFQCATVPGCTPATCQSAGVNCGPIGDGCGGLIASCGTCPTDNVCGGVTPGVCAAPMVNNADMAVPCGRFCGMFGNCAAGTTTTVTGTVVAGTDSTLGFGNPNPIYNALVYVPVTSPAPFGTQVSCDQCGAEVTGTPLVSQNTGIDGKFTLTDVPCGTGINLPIVIQLGRWRRQIVVKDVACCAPLALTLDQTRMPRNKTEGDIPHIAVSTGKVDALECVLRKMGIQDSEFTQSSGTGRVHIYKGNGADDGNNTPNESALVGSTTTLDNYDMVLFPCWGGQTNKALTSQQNLISFADKGGRVFATHFSYTWLATVGTVMNPKDGVPGGTPPEPAPWVGTAAFNVNQGSYDGPLNGIVDQSFPKGAALATWLAQASVGASVTAGQIPINVVRKDVDSVVAPSQRWISTAAPDPVVPVVHYTFNTPVGTAADKQCGRVVFSDFHVENGRNLNNDSFPGECGKAAPMTPQEKLLEFMLFDLSSCVTPDNPPATCTPRTCAQLGAQCGPQGDGCGAVIQCGDCPPGQACGAGGVPNQCGNVPCTPITCDQAGAQCGVIGDGCNGTVDCGPCPNGKSCGSGGIPNQCNIIG